MSTHPHTPMKPLLLGLTVAAAGCAWGSLGTTGCRPTGDVCGIWTSASRQQ